MWEQRPVVLSTTQKNIIGLRFVTWRPYDVTWKEKMAAKVANTNTWWAKPSHSSPACVSVFCSQGGRGRGRRKRPDRAARSSRLLHGPHPREVTRVSPAPVEPPLAASFCLVHFLLLTSRRWVFRKMIPKCVFHHIGKLTPVVSNGGSLIEFKVFCLSSSCKIFWYIG